MLIRFIIKGQSLVRALMNKRCCDIDLENKKVLDLGSGKKLSFYHSLFKTKPKSVFTTDLKQGGDNHVSINFEKDKLPFNEFEFDAVLSFNVFEHIFNYNFLISEIYRVLKKDGELIGFVPFLLNYHPDPKDYFRYTEEALFEIFKNNGFSNIKIEIIGKGPFYVNYNNIMLSLPKIFRLVLLPAPLVLDYLFIKLKPKSIKRYPLGYFFVVKK